MIYNAGYLEGRDLPKDKDLLEHVPLEIPGRGPVAPVGAWLS